MEQSLSSHSDNDGVKWPPQCGDIIRQNFADVINSIDEHIVHVVEMKEGGTKYTEFRVSSIRGVFSVYWEKEDFELDFHIDIDPSADKLWIPCEYVVGQQHI